MDGLLSGVSFTSPFTGSIEILVDRFRCIDSSPLDGAVLTVACTP